MFVEFNAFSKPWSSKVMAKYVLIITGSNILLDSVAEEVATGFVTLKTVKAASEEDAMRFGQINVLQEWKSLFNRDNKAGTPKLTVRSVKRVRNPFRRYNLPSDFVFFGNEDEQLTALNAADKVVR